MPSTSDAVAAATTEPGLDDVLGAMVVEKQQVKARAYQQDLVDVAKSNNVIISLATGAGKTLIAAEVIRHKLPALQAANKAVLFMAPTNPLVAQQCDEALGKTHGFRVRAYHGSMNNQRLSQWGRDKWDEVLAETDVLVMTPDVLLHTLSHGVFRMSDIGLLIFDEAHHCKSDHPYNQLLQDFYHTLPVSDRPQILGLTASPDGMEKDERRRKGKPLNMGLQHNMNAYLITVPREGPFREELNAAVPWPSSHLLNYKSTPASGVIADSLAWLNWTKDCLLKPAKRCEAICEMLRHQELLASAGLADAGMSIPSFDGFMEGSRVSALDKQIRGVLYCLENLGPWCAAAAAYLDLLAPPAENGAEEEAEPLAAQLADDEDDMDDYAADIAATGDPSRSFYDDLGGPPDVLLAELRQLLGQVVDFLRIHAEQEELSVIITPAELDAATTARAQDLPAARAAAEAARVLAEKQKAARPGEAGGFVADGISTGSAGVELEWCARGLLKLACKVSLLITMNVLADVLVDDKDCKKQLMQQAGGSPGCFAVEQRLSGSLQGFAEMLLRRVPFSLLEAQVWPELLAEHVQPWHGPPLLTDKVVTLLRLLDEDRKRCVAAAEANMEGMGQDAAKAAAEDWWACMVFVETKLSALVLSKLLSSLPSMCKHLRSGYLLGDTRHDGTTGGLAMNNKQQARVVAGFRTSAINVLIATSIGSEGMNFKQCQLVVAFDLPRDVTSYIQCRGRGRKAGSRYCFMQQEEHKLNIFSLVRKAGALEERAKGISEQNRALLAATPGLQLRTEPDIIDPCTRLQTPCGALVTLRLAQQLLAEYCGKLPGSDRVTMLQAYYSTSVSAGLFHTVVYLPSNSGIPSKVDDAAPGVSSKQSKQQAALRALRLLYSAGKLNDNLQPVWVTQRHHKQLEAEPLPNYAAAIHLQAPLCPQLLEPNYAPAATAADQASSTAAERTLTLHMHTFVYGKRASSTSQAGKAAGNSTLAGACSDGTSAALAEAYNAAEKSLLEAVVGSDEALAALPGGPAVSGGMKLPYRRKLCFGVLLWEQLPAGLMQWPVWIERKLYVMDVEYEGTVSLRESQVQQLLGYQSAANKHINWGKTRAKWLKQARDLDKQEAAAAAAADDHDDHRTSTEGGDAASAMQLDGTPAGAAAATNAGTAGNEEQRQPMLPFKPDLLKRVMGWERAAARAATDMTAAETAAQAKHQTAADGQDDGQEQEDRGVWSPPERLSYLIVPIAGTSIKKTPAANAERQTFDGCVPSAFSQAAGKALPGLTAPEHDSAAVSPAGGLPIAVGDAAGGGSSLPMQTHADAGDTNDTSSSSAVGIDWNQVNLMASGLVSLSSFLAAACRLPVLQHVEATRMELPPSVPPPALPLEQVTAALAAGLTPPLQGAAAMTPLPAALQHAAVCNLEAALMGRIVVAGHSSHVYSVVGVAADLTPSSSVSAVIAQLSKQMGFKDGIDTSGKAQTLDKCDPGDVGGLAYGNGPVLAAAVGEHHTAAAGTAGSSSTDNAAGKVGIHPDGGCTNPAHTGSSSAPLLARPNPAMAAALLLSSSMVEHDPEKRPLLGWKVGKTADGKPIWESADRHDDYYRMRCAITGLRPDLPMLAVKSSRGLTDSCLLPPKVLKNSIKLPGLKEAKQQAEAAAAAGQPSGSSTSATVDACTDNASKGEVRTALPKAVRFAGAVNEGMVYANSSAAAPGAGSISPKRAACSDVAEPAAWQSGPDKRIKVSIAGEMAADNSSAASFIVQGMDRLAQYEQRQEQASFLCNSSLPGAITEQSRQLIGMSRSGRRKVWAQHRVMFLPLELVWLLPISSGQWSQLQLLPNIIYRLDSMLSALNVHKKLQEVFHGSERGAAAAEDECVGGWEHPFGNGCDQLGIALLEPSHRVHSLGRAGAVDDTATAAATDGTAGLCVPAEPNGVTTEAAAASADMAMTDAHMAAATGNTEHLAKCTAGSAAECAESCKPGHWKDMPLPTPRLLLLSLTASSCHEAFDLERLEFLGDVVLKVLANCCLLKLLPPDANEGELSVGKARLVRNVRLAQVGSSPPLLLQHVLRFHPYNDDLWTPTGTACTLGLFRDGPMHTFKGKRIADGVEAMIGAFYIAGAAKEAADATTGATGNAPAAAAAAGSTGGVGAHSSSNSVLQQLAGGGAHDAASWVWDRVSRPGLLAAATFCEAVGVLPPGAAKTVASSPMPTPFKEPQSPNQLSLLHPSYTAAINNFFHNARDDNTADAGAAQLSLNDRIARKLRDMPLGPFPYTFKNTALLAQAVTHVSVLGSQSYQRLEFLGDCLLDLIVSLKSLSRGQGEGYHLGPAELTKWRSSIVSNNTLSTAAVLTGLHTVLRASNWRLLLGVRTFAAEVRAQYGKDKPTGTQATVDRETAATALQLAANQGQLHAAAASAGPTRAANTVTAVASTVGVVPADVAAKLAQDVLDDDTIWAAVWMRKKELTASQKAAAQAAKLAVPGCKGDLDKAVATAAAAGDVEGRDTGDVDMQEAEATTAAASDSPDSSQHCNGANGEDAAAADCEAAGTSDKKTKIKLPKVMADLVEALTAAVYCDSGADWGPTWDAVNYMLFLHQGDLQELQLQLPPPKATDTVVVLDEDDSENGE